MVVILGEVVVGGGGWEERRKVRLATDKVFGSAARVSSVKGQHSTLVQRIRGLLWT